MGSDAMQKRRGKSMKETWGRIDETILEGVVGFGV